MDFLGAGVGADAFGCCGVGTACCWTDDDCAGRCCAVCCPDALRFGNTSGGNDKFHRSCSVRRSKYSLIISSFTSCGKVSWRSEWLKIAMHQYWIGCNNVRGVVSWAWGDSHC